MAYDERLAGRMRAILAARPAIGERKMFGGIAFMQRGHMLCGVIGDEMIVRLGTDAYADAPHTRPFDFTGRPMRTTLFVEPAGIKTAAALTRWIDRAAEFTETLPPKKEPARKKPVRVTQGKQPAR